MRSDVVVALGHRLECSRLGFRHSRFPEGIRQVHGIPDDVAFTVIEHQEVHILRACSWQVRLHHVLTAIVMSLCRAAPLFTLQLHL